MLILSLNKCQINISKIMLSQEELAKLKIKEICHSKNQKN